MAEIVRVTLLLGFTVLCLTASCQSEPLEDVSEDFVPLLMRRNDFFLKAAKSIPRIGRRNDFFFTKAVKSVPRIGRRNDFFMKAAKSIPRIGRREDLTTIERDGAAVWPWFRDHDFIPRVMKKDDLELIEEPNSKLVEFNKEREEPRFQPLV